MPKPIVGWFEVTGKDGPALQRFYSKLFGWSVNDAGDGSGYRLVEAGEKGIAGGVGACVRTSSNRDGADERRPTGSPSRRRLLAVTPRSTASRHT
jgi:predicted enzyme related to lactoylglutathione lyase